MTRYEAYIGKGWQELGIATVLVLRHRTDGSVDAGFFLVDCWCLGVKDAWVENEAPAAWVEENVTAHLPEEQRERIHPACARKLIEGALAYAERLGFAPHRDFRKARKVLSGIDASLCPTDFTFGREGKPCYVAGPDDSDERIDRVLAILEQHCGPDGYTCELPGDEEEIDIGELRDELQTWLDGEPQDVPRFYQVSGLITAMQLCPQPLAPTRLLEVLWGTEGRTWEDEEELRYATRLLSAYWYSVADLIAAAVDPAAKEEEQIIDVWSDDFEEDGDFGVIAAHLEWAIGFVRATELWPEAWGATLQRPDLAPHWEVIRWWSDFIGGETKEQIAAAAEETPPRTLARCVTALARALRPPAPSAT